METTTSYAAEYSARIGQEMAALERLLCGDDTPADWDRLGLEPDRFDIHGDGAHYVAGVWIGETILEAVHYRATDDSGRTRTVWLRTCGGPRCEITRDSDDGSAVEITTWSGSDRATVRLYLSAVAEMLDESANY